MAENGFLSELEGKIRAIPARAWDDIFLVIAVFLIALASFGIGRLSILYEADEPLRVFYPEEQETSAAVETGEYVASISGTKYHLPWCSGAQNIKEGNKIWFNTKEEAELSGYEPAANCPGL